MNDFVSAGSEGQATNKNTTACENGGCCCLMGPGGRARFVLYVLGAVVFLGLIAYGFIA